MSSVFPRSLRGLRRGCLLFPLLLLLVGAALTALLPPANPQDPGLVRAAVRRAPASTGGPHDRQPGTGGPPDPQPGTGGPPDPQPGFTAIIQTFNRTDLLLRLLNHYQGVPGLRRVVVVWNNVGQRCPQDLWDRLGPHPVPVLFKEQSANLMRNRLQPFAEIDTDAVLMLDDDTLVSLPDLSFAFSVWKSFPDQIVGFVPRKHVTTASGIYSYGSFELQDPEKGGDRYSMVLIGAAFFHRRYLHLFPQQPAEVLSLVDDTQNCDDIAVNFLVALHLARGGAGEGAVAGGDRPAGVLVKPVDVRNLEKEASSGYLGMWHRPEHLLQRSYCLNRLAHIYGTMPLRYSNIMLVQFGFPSYANHKARA